jgi:DNA replication protein DnaC
VSARETPSDMAVIDETVTLCRRLRLKYVREQVSDVMLTARAQRWDPAEALRVLLVAESEGRDRSTIETRRRRAHFPAGKTFASWVETRSSVPAATLQALRGLEWVGRAENVVVAGPQGTGKSHLLEALGHHAVDQGLSVAWFSVEDLGAIIRRHRVDDTVSKAFAALASTSLCVIDDIGLLPISSDAAEGLYRLVDAAYERRALALSTNLHPSGFDQLMDKTIASALVDRLMHHAHIIVTDGESVRLADALAGKGVVPLS